MYKVQEPSFWKGRIKEARTIEQAVYLTTREKWHEIENAHLQVIAGCIKPEDRVLDAGCGLGQLSQGIKNYTGLDISPDLLKEARIRYPDKTFIEGDINKLDFPDGHFDWAIISSIRDMILKYEGAEKWQPMEKELKRVAKKVLILDYLKPAEYEIC